MLNEYALFFVIFDVVNIYYLKNQLKKRLNCYFTDIHSPWHVGGGASICSLSPRRHVRISLPTNENPGWHLYLMMSPVCTKSVCMMKVFRKQSRGSEKEQQNG